jgi:hypothetical protein
MQKQGLHHVTGTGMGSVSQPCPLLYFGIVKRSELTICLKVSFQVQHFRWFEVLCLLSAEYKHIQSGDAERAIM